MLNAWDEKKSKKKTKKIYYTINPDKGETIDFFINRILAWRKVMVKDTRYTEQDIHDYDKHFGII